MCRKRVFRLSIIIVFSVFLLTLFYVAPKEKEIPPLIICDVHDDSPRIVKEDGSIEHADYVRIRNNTDVPYTLSGLFLSDSKKNLKKFPLDGLVVGADDSVMIRLDPSWNFALKREGNENVYLSDDKGNILFKYSESMKPKTPIFSADSGIYEGEFYLSVYGEEDCTIYYSLDGSEPGEGSMIYDEPICVYDRSPEPNSVVNAPNAVLDYLTVLDDDDPDRRFDKPILEPVDKAFIVRAVAMDAFGNKSDIVTREFFFCGDKYRNIISVVADPDDLFGDYGIASVGKEYDEWYLGDRDGDQPSPNFDNKGMDWEIPADLDYFRGGKRVFGQRCGLRLQGRSTRSMRIKNFQLRARNRYSGSDVFEYDFFDNEAFRSGGLVLNNCFEESFFLSLIDNEKIVKQKTTDGAALFVNGEFWCGTYVAQRLDEKYFDDHFGITPDNLLVLNESFPEIGGDNEFFDAARASYLELDEFAKDNDLSIKENYEKIQTMMDIDSYIDYLAINTWNGNADFSEYENDMYWRVKTPYDNNYGDGRFRWIIHDCDGIFRDTIKLTNRGFYNEGVLYSSLMNNMGFRKRLAERITQLGQTSFSDENIRSELENGKWNEPQKESIKEFYRTRKYKMSDLANDLASEKISIQDLIQ